MRPWECSQTDRYTDTLTDANRCYNLSHAICYSYGTDNKKKLTKHVYTAYRYAVRTCGEARKASVSVACLNGVEPVNGVYTNITALWPTVRVYIYTRQSQLCTIFKCWIDGVLFGCRKLVNSRRVTSVTWLSRHIHHIHRALSIIIVCIGPSVCRVRSPVVFYLYSTTGNISAKLA